jgi:K+-sensing histidine kinase KdpD
MVHARPFALAAAVVAPVAACALLSLLRGTVTNNNAALVLVLVVVAVAATGYRVAGLVAAVVSAASFDFFLTQPYLQFAIAERDDIEAAVLLALIGLAVTEIALWGRRQQARASARAGYLRGVVSAARLAATGVTSASDLVELVARQIGDVLGIDECRFDPTPHPDADRPTLQADGAVVWRGRPVDVDREGLPTLDAIELPVTSAGVDHGRFLLVSTSAVRRPDLERRLVAVTLAEQAAAALAGGALSTGRGRKPADGRATDNGTAGTRQG